MKPLFIPLKKEWYAEFVAGRKSHEIRPYGPRWNERTCFLGRDVTLSKGYGKQDRTKGEITRYEILDDYGHLPEPYRTQYLNVYGERTGKISFIRIALKG